MKLCVARAEENGEYIGIGELWLVHAREEGTVVPTGEHGGEPRGCLEKVVCWTGSSGEERFTHSVGEKAGDLEMHDGASHRGGENGAGWPTGEDPEGEMEVIGLGY